MYLGKSIPKYVLNNYRYLESTFPDKDVWLILDSPRLAEVYAQRGIRVWLSNEIKNEGSHYRHGFWSKTLNRFFALEEFHNSHDQYPILHVEADVILAKNFPFESFSELSLGIAFPLAKPGVAVASTVWLKKPEDTRQLCDFIRERQSVLPGITDTEALGQFALHSSRVAKLRSGLDSRKSYRQTEIGAILSGDNLSINDIGIFDASTFGIFLCGTDPRNNFGFSRVFSPLSHHHINPKSVDFYLQDSYLYAKSEAEIRPIYSLHNHSKNSRFFNSGFETRLHHRYVKRNGEEYSVFSLGGFLGFAADYFGVLLKRIRRELAWVRK